MNNEISSLAKRVGYQPGDMNLFFIRMKMISKRGQLPKQNFYSSKKCECCGPYHGSCSIKEKYWIDMEEYDIYPEDRSDFECDGCRNIDDGYKFFTGQNPKIDCPHFRVCRFCKGTGVYANQLFESLGSICLHIEDTADDDCDYYPIVGAVSYYWYGKNMRKSDLECAYDAYLKEPKYCPFCHGTGYLSDPIEAVLVSRYAEDLMEYESFDDAGQYLNALHIWHSMKWQKKFFHSDFSYFKKLEAKV
jgi:hypothetical protein